MLAFNHPNVMTMRGVCVDHECPLLIMPFMSNGNVLEYVKHHKENLLLLNQSNTMQVTVYVCTVIGHTNTHAIIVSFVTDRLSS